MYECPKPTNACKCLQMSANFRKCANVCKYANSANVLANVGALANVRGLAHPPGVEVGGGGAPLRGGDGVRVKRLRGGGQVASLQPYTLRASRLTRSRVYIWV